MRGSPPAPASCDDGRRGTPRKRVGTPRAGREEAVARHRLSELGVAAPRGRGRELVRARGGRHGDAVTRLGLALA